MTGGGVRTTREEAVFAQDGNGIDEEDGSWEEKVSQGALLEGRGGHAVEEAAEEEHGCGGGAAAREIEDGRKMFERVSGLARDVVRCR